MTATIHPFPARMAPELALEALKNIARGGTIVDPMMGSGTVIRQATDLGLNAMGFDMDPLAVLMSRVWTTPVEDDLIERVHARAAKIALAADPGAVTLPWIDGDKETRDFIAYWFGSRQSDALRCWSSAIMELDDGAFGPEAAALDVLRIALSRIIVTKEQCASLARDTSHSRPHRVALTSDYCVHQGLGRSLKMVRKRLLIAPPSAGASVMLGDARSMTLGNEAADAVLTSPPYLNAIDYLRGHRMSLVWLGHKLSDLRAIRSASIGAERGPDAGTVLHTEVKDALGDLAELPRRHEGMIDRFVADVVGLASEVKRVLRPGGVATMVVGNSTLKGVFIKNSAAVAKALELQGMNFVGEVVRDLPSQSRYLPTTAGSSLANRMRQETVLRWAA
jgi:DNA modification methylase